MTFPQGHQAFYDSRIICRRVDLGRFGGSTPDSAERLYLFQVTCFQKSLKPSFTDSEKFYLFLRLPICQTFGSFDNFSLFCPKTSSVENGRF